MARNLTGVALVLLASLSIPHLSISAMGEANAQEVPSQKHSHNQCDDIQRPWDYLMGTILNRLTHKDDVEFGHSKVSFIRIDAAPPSQGVECVFDVSGTMRARTESGEMHWYSYSAEVAEQPLLNTATITEFNIDHVHPDNTGS